MTAPNRLQWFEWLAGVGGAAIFGLLGIMAIAQRHIVLAGRTTGPTPADGPAAVLMGAVLLAVSWLCLIVLFRASPFRRIFQGAALLFFLGIGVAAYAGAF
jgi:hypothetical protein